MAKQTVRLVDRPSVQQLLVIRYSSHWSACTFSNLVIVITGALLAVCGANAQI